KYKGRWREMVNRSALMLKLLISREHGSLIAAPTFSVPEQIGGVRNWDYRFTWLRDAAFTLYALIRLGFVDETEAFIDWLKGRLGAGRENSCTPVCCAGWLLIEHCGLRRNARFRRRSALGCERATRYERISSKTSGMRICSLSSSRRGLKTWMRRSC